MSSDGGSDKFIPDGQPLKDEELEAIANINLQDIAQSVAKASPEIKPYLQAKRD